MHTVYDYINREIPPKEIRLGWKVEVSKRGCVCLNYTAINFDWKSLEFLGDEAYDLFLSSKSYSNLKEKMESSKSKFKRTYYECMSISELKEMLESDGLEVNVDKIVEKARKKLIAKNEEVARMREKIRKEKDIEQRKMSRMCHYGKKAVSSGRKFKKRK